jgi:hypothetical protein
MGEVVKLGLALALVAAVASMAGCGDGGSSQSSTLSDPLAGYPKGPTRGFIIPGGDNAVPLYGREATVTERAQASAIVQKWMAARAAKRFSEECRYFSRSYIKALVTEDAEKVTEGRVKTCPQALAYFGPQASGDFKNTLTGPIDSLRAPTEKSAHSLNADQGFALFHGKGGSDYEIPMNREGGKWWVGAATPIPRAG